MVPLALPGLLLLALAPPAATGSSASSGYCPGKPPQEECGPLYGNATVQYHARDTSCSNGDPNGMFYDAVHGMYHVFYQTFKGPPCDPPVPPCDSGTEVWGHVVSKDLT
jgi:hypothetical protein